MARWVLGGLLLGFLLGLLVAGYIFLDSAVDELAAGKSEGFAHTVEVVEELGGHADVDLLFGDAFFSHKQHGAESYHLYANKALFRLQSQAIVSHFSPTSPLCPLFGQVEAASMRVPHGAEERCVIRKRKKANVSSAWSFKTHAMTFQVVLAEVPLHSEDGFRCMCRVDPENKVILVSSDVPASVRIALVGKALALIWRKELAVNGKLPDVEYGAEPSRVTAISHVTGPDGIPLMLIDPPASVPQRRRAIKSALKAVARRSTATKPFRRPCAGPRV